jgi:hypothetical protein
MADDLNHLSWCRVQFGSPESCPPLKLTAKLQELSAAKVQ